MRLVLSLAPRLLQVCRCRVCQQSIDSPAGSLHYDEVEQRLFGYKQYAKCPSCGHTVEDHQDRNYRARVRRFLARREATK
jgi:hypothetical protein